MLRFMKNWLGPKASPIGVDFGSDALRLAQVAKVDGEWKLVAAASADVPAHVRHNPAARMEFFVEATRDLLAHGDFSGRAAVLALPAASMFIQHLRLPKMDDEAMRKAIPWEARGKLPIDPSNALLRHHVAGDIFQDQESKSEVILMAAGRELVNQFLATATRARLDVTGMNVEPKALVDCFSHIYRRKADAEAANCFVDLGCSGSRAFVARGGHILFARTIPVGGDHFTRAVSHALHLSQDEAKLLRMKLSNIQPAINENQRKQEVRAGLSDNDEVAGLGALGTALAAANRAEGQDRRGPGTLTMDPPVTTASLRPEDGDEGQRRQIEDACQEPFKRLVQELDLCRRYYEATFPNKPVERLIFVGGEAKNRRLCQQIAQEMGLAAQVGDPLVRMGRTSEVGPESGIDRRQPQPNWAVAIGLSLGPINVEERAREIA
jgi:type IV pilus assembly protein PilM